MDSWINATPAQLIPLLIALILAWGFVRMVNDEDHPVEWWHFVAARNDTGQERGDINSVGMVAGVIVSLFVPLWIVYDKGNIDPWILAVCLIYLGGVKMFASWLRSLADRKLAPVSPPPLPAPKTTTTTTETKTEG